MYIFNVKIDQITVYQSKVLINISNKFSVFYAKSLQNNWNHCTRSGISTLINYAVHVSNIYCKIVIVITKIQRGATFLEGKKQPQKNSEGILGRTESSQDTSK